ncbi:MAG: hypothetical protein IPL27_02065 [Lewinellaceae bacterium]|nr:hypothetical protein [Lewinellaceae bacterium]
MFIAADADPVEGFTHAEKPDEKAVQHHAAAAACAISGFVVGVAPGKNGAAETAANFAVFEQGFVLLLGKKGRRRKDQGKKNSFVCIAFMLKVEYFQLRHMKPGYPDGYGDFFVSSE